jgi:hypothetical protein
LKVWLHIVHGCKAVPSKTASDNILSENDVEYKILSNGILATTISTLKSLAAIVVGIRFHIYKEGPDFSMEHFNELRHHLRLVHLPALYSVLPFSLYACTPRQDRTAAGSTDHGSSFSTTRATFSSIRTFRKTANTKQFGIPGSETAMVYPSPLGTLYLYQKYSVVIAKEARTGTDTIEVSRRQEKSMSDGISISSVDSVLVRVGDFGLWFFGLKDNYFFFDVGAGPHPRSLVIIDFTTIDTLFNASYSEPINLEDTSHVVHFAPVTEATEANCPDYKKWKNEDFSPYIEEKRSLNLLTKTGRQLGETRCVPYE